MSACLVTGLMVSLSLLIAGSDEPSFGIGCFAGAAVVVIGCAL